MRDKKSITIAYLKLFGSIIGKEGGKIIDIISNMITYTEINNPFIGGLSWRHGLRSVSFESIIGRFPILVWIISPEAQFCRVAHSGANLTYRLMLWSGAQKSRCRERRPKGIIWSVKVVSGSSLKRRRMLLTITIIVSSSVRTRIKGWRVRDNLNFEQGFMT
jgi:hypothetical protein